MEDKLAQHPVPDADTTAILEGKAEPGRDIFAGEPVKEIQSHNPPAAPPAPEEPKEISAVVTRSAVVPPPANIDEVDKDSDEAKTTSAESITALSTSGGLDQVVAAVEGEAPAGAKNPLVGPLVEAEVEAEKVAHELYPDAPEK